MILGGALSVSGFFASDFFGNPIGTFCPGNLFRCQTDRGTDDDLSSREIYCGNLGRDDHCCFHRFHDFHGLCAPDRKESQSDVYAGYQRNHDRIYLFSSDRFCGDFADDSNIVNLHNWSMGSFSGTTWENVSTMTVVVMTALIITFLMSKPIGAYQLGEGYAQNMGVNIKAFRIALILLSSILSACVTAFAGSDFLCWNCGAASGKKPAQNIKTASCDPGLLPWEVLYSVCSVT